MPRFSLAVRITLSLLLVFVPLAGFDQWLYDHLFRLSGKSRLESPYVLIRVSEGKLYQLLGEEKLNFPEEAISVERSSHPVWHQQFYKKLIEKLESASPRLLVFTSFYEWIDQRAPYRFSYPNIIFSGLIDDEGKLVPPPKSLTRTDNYGFNNLFPDPDNVLRQAHLVYSSGQSLALKSYQALNSSPPVGDLIEPIHVYFRGSAGSFPSYDAWDIFDGSIPLEDFSNKIVLIGKEGSPSNDLETPFGKMSRLEIHANVLSTFLEGNQILFPGKYWNYLVSFCAVAISIFLILYFPLSVAWVLLLLLAFSLSLFNFIGLTFLKIWPGLASPLFCILGTHLLLIGFKIGRQEEKQWRIQEESRYLKEMDQFKNNFVSLFSHDLKTPISKIRAITDRIFSENPSLNSSVQEGLKGIERANNELARLISDILRVTKMESMPIEPAKEVVDINRLVESALQRLKFIFDEKKIRVVQDLEPLFSTEGDPHLLLEVITNLVENAVKYSPPDSQVVIRTRELPGKISVSVLDEGPGIPPEELPRVTSKFYRGKTADKTTRGSGLGLYLAKYFVETHGGELTIQSEWGKGTEVSFTLPIS
jgi:two-component system phosphate regulon sensor histidine kinase PhoR